MPKISALPPMTSLDSADPAPVVDDSASTTKKTTMAQIRDWLYSLVNIPAGPASPVTRDSEHFFDHIASGLVITADNAGTNRNASMTAGIVYINGRRISISAVVARTYTASRDTYVDILDNLDGTGTLVYTEVTNNNASPALAANSTRIGIVVTGASTIATANSINQGQEDRLLPIVSSIPYAVCDSLGNVIANRSPDKAIIGFRQSTTTYTASGTSGITGMSTPVIIPAGRKVKITGTPYAGAANAASYAEMRVYTGASLSALTTQVAASQFGNVSGGGFPGSAVTIRSLAAGLIYVTAALMSSSGNANIYGATSAPTTLIIEVM